MTPPVFAFCSRRARRFRHLAVSAVLLAGAPSLAVAQSLPVDRPAPIRPVLPLSVGKASAPLYLGLADDQPHGTLSAGEAVVVMSRVYGYQSDILLALAQGDTDEAEGLFELAMADLARLSRHEEVLSERDRPRYRELYRSVITEYEQYYGVEPGEVQLQRGGVFALRAEMFAALNDDLASLDGVTLPDVRPAETEFPMTRHRLVDQSMAFLLRNPDAHLYRWIERSYTYFPMIEQILEEEGVPDELKYLAMIESGLRPNVSSWAQAGGMWQFIRATGRAYGLDTDEWVDERMDPEKATRAAARHLRDLHKMFGGDWQLALAGYNCSPARIRRALHRAEQRLGRTPTFWDIYDDIPRETRNYVPQFIATALLASNPDALDLSRITPGPQYTYDRVPVHGPLPLSQAARLTGVDEDVLRALNPELRRHIVPRTSSPYGLRVPAGAGRLLVAGLQGDPSETSGEVRHTVAQGETLTWLARHYGTTTEAIRNRNSLSSGKLQAGKTLVVPLPYHTASSGEALAEGQIEYVQFARRPVRPIFAEGTQRDPAPAVRTRETVRTERPSVPVRTVSASTAPAPARAERSTRAAAPAAREAAERTVYRVQRGDNLSTIASRHGVTVGQIRNWNDLTSSRINAGQRLTIYGASASAAPAAAAPARPTTHKVVRGDNLTELAQRYGTSVANLRAWNGLSSSTIQVGQRLKVQAPGGPTTHKVVRGDNLTEIAQRYGVSVSDLRQWNGLRGSTIRPGQNLRVSG
jgi:membrane-bound lytic murein transglycosylase D